MAFSRRTDLAFEACSMLDKTVSRSLSDGIVSSVEKCESCTVERTRISTPEAARALGKAEGSYVTLSFSESDLKTQKLFKKAARRLAGELSALLKLQKGESVLVAGLGNPMMTPDAIGTQTARRIIATRHLARDENLSSLRPVSVIAPGVTGMTGFESGELIADAATRSGASAIIAVDALASRSLERLCTTVQLSDTGIAPGSGLGVRHLEINSRTAGVRVISVGVPTLTDAATAAADVLEKAGLDPAAAGISESSLFVTVKDIDEKIRFFSRLVAIAINLALQPGLTVEDICDLLSL